VRIPIFCSSSRYHWFSISVSLTVVVVCMSTLSHGNPHPERPRGVQLEYAPLSLVLHSVHPDAAKASVEGASPELYFRYSVQDRPRGLRLTHTLHELSLPIFWQERNKQFVSSLSMIYAVHRIPVLVVNAKGTALDELDSYRGVFEGMEAKVFDALNDGSLPTQEAVIDYAAILTTVALQCLKYSTGIQQIAHEMCLGALCLFFEKNSGLFSGNAPKAAITDRMIDFVREGALDSVYLERIKSDWTKLIAYYKRLTPPFGDGAHSKAQAAEEDELEQIKFPITIDLKTEELERDRVQQQRENCIRASLFELAEFSTTWRYPFARFAPFEMYDESVLKVATGEWYSEYKWWLNQVDVGGVKLVQQFLLNLGKQGVSHWHFLLKRKELAGIVQSIYTGRVPESPVLLLEAFDRYFEDNNQSLELSECLIGRAGLPKANEDFSKLVVWLQSIRDFRQHLYQQIKLPITVSFHLEALPSHLNYYSCDRSALIFSSGIIPEPPNLKERFPVQLTILTDSGSSPCNSIESAMKVSVNDICANLKIPRGTFIGIDPKELIEKIRSYNSTDTTIVNQLVKDVETFTSALDYLLVLTSGQNGGDKQRGRRPSRLVPA
jgi:hypothetical protein